MIVKSMGPHVALTTEYVEENSSCLLQGMPRKFEALESNLAAGRPAVSVMSTENKVELKICHYSSL